MSALRALRAAAPAGFYGNAYSTFSKGIALLRAEGFEIVRCRRRDAAAVVELPADDRDRVTPALLDTVRSAMQAVDPDLVSLTLDDRPYRPGQAVLHVSEGSHARSR